MENHVNLQLLYVEIRSQHSSPSENDYKFKMAVEKLNEQVQEQ